MILIMWSGGLDSTGALYKLLTETKEPIHAHHIDIQNIEQRWVPERHAITNLYKECLKIRKFKVTTSTYEFLQFQKFITWDNDLVRFVAAQICKNDPEIKQLALGKCADDDADVSFRVRVLQARTLWNACFLDSILSPPEIIRPVGEMTKKQIWDMLPEDIQKFTWSCRTPVITKNSYSYCLNCKTCKEMIKYGMVKDTPAEQNVKDQVADVFPGEKTL